LFALFEKSISKLAAVLWGDSWVCLALLKDDNNVPDDACVWFSYYRCAGFGQPWEQMII